MDNARKKVQNIKGFLELSNFSFSHLLELVKAMPVSEEEDLSSSVRGDIGSELRGAQLYLGVELQITSLVQLEKRLEF